MGLLMMLGNSATLSLVKIRLLTLRPAFSEQVAFSSNLICTLFKKDCQSPRNRDICILPIVRLKDYLD